MIRLTRIKSPRSAGVVAGFSLLGLLGNSGLKSPDRSAMSTRTMLVSEMRI